MLKFKPKMGTVWLILSDLDDTNSFSNTSAIITFLHYIWSHYIFIHINYQAMWLKLPFLIYEDFVAKIGYLSHG